MKKTLLNILFFVSLILSMAEPIQAPILGVLLMGLCYYLDKEKNIFIK